MIANPSLQTKRFFPSCISSSALPRLLSSLQLRVSQIFQNCPFLTKELMLSLSMNFTVSFFIPSSDLTLLATAFLIQSIGSLFFSQVSSGKRWQWIHAFFFSVLSARNFQLLLHETGHALAALLVYQRACPGIEISLFLGGFNEFQKGALTAFGQWLGRASCTCFVIAAGPALTLCCSSFLFFMGLKVMGEHPRFGKMLLACSLLDFVDHMHYAYTALYAEPWKLSHDFYHLSIFGVSPLAAIAGIAALPVLLTLGHLLNRSKTT